MTLPVGSIRQLATAVTVGREAYQQAPPKRSARRLADGD
jgi:hypothetical protein